MKIKYLVALAIISGNLFSCKKDWLDAKPNISLTIPNTVADYQALLDNSDEVFNVNYPLLGEIGADDYYISFTNWQALFTATEKNAYIWASDIYEGANCQDWNSCYTIIYNSNIAIDGIQNIQPDDATKTAWDNVYGSALFFRSFAFYNLLQLFAKAYDATSAVNDPGIPLRLSADINDKSERASVNACYEQIVNDLIKAAAMLPVSALHKSRPSKPAAFTLLARTFLSMGRYEEAALYADSSLQLYNTLLNFNTLDVTQDYPVPMFNEEDMLHTWGISYYIFFPSNLIVDSALYSLYEKNDLRRTVFFTRNGNDITYKGSYSGLFIFYTGIATDETYLINAEANIRTGNIDAALQRLNALLEYRFITGTFVPVAETNHEKLLDIILIERRKELLFRGLRWGDLKRLNKETRYAKTLARDLNNQVYTLPPNDEKYVLPIPQQEIDVSGIAQNPR